MEEEGVAVEEEAGAEEGVAIAAILTTIVPMTAPIMVVPVIHTLMVPRQLVIMRTVPAKADMVMTAAGTAEAMKIMAIEEEGVVVAVAAGSVAAIVTVTIETLVVVVIVAVADALRGQPEMTPFMTALLSKESNVRDHVAHSLSGISSTSVRRQFEEFGEIKTFFDLIANRGMVFVTYYDVRAAERARERLQDSEISGRPIDVHYSLPRGDEQAGRCERDKNQGTLLITLRQSNQTVDDHELRRLFQRFGDVKQILPAEGRNDQRLLEMYDSRAMETAHDHLQGQPLQDGIMDIEFAWDVPETPLPPGPVPGSKYKNANMAETQIRNPGDGEEDGAGVVFEANTRSERETAVGTGIVDGPVVHAVTGTGMDMAPDEEAGLIMRSPLVVVEITGLRPPEIQDTREVEAQVDMVRPAPVQLLHLRQPADDRLEQAKKVQQLLAALKQSQPAGAPTPPPQVAPPANNPPPPNPYAYPPSLIPSSMPPFPPAGYSAPPPGYPYPPPPPSQPVAQPNADQPPASLASLPPSVLALLQQGPTAQASPPPAQPPQGMYGIPGYGAYAAPPQQLPPPPHMPPPSQSPPAAGQTPQAMQQLMALLSAHKRV
ncbi:RNA recognition motif, partial [Rhizoctonia solani]